MLQPTGVDAVLSNPTGRPSAADISMQSSVNVHLQILPLPAVTASEKLHEPRRPRAACKATTLHGPHGSHARHLSHMPQGPPMPPEPPEPCGMVDEMHDNDLTTTTAWAQAMSAITKEFDNAVAQHRAVVMSSLARHLQQRVVDQESKHQQTPVYSDGHSSDFITLMACAQNQREQQEVQAVPPEYITSEEPSELRESKERLVLRKGWTMAEEMAATKSARKAWDANECLFDSARQQALKRMTGLQRVTRSKYYEWCTGVLILVNTVFVGFETEHAARQLYTNNPGGQIFFTWASLIMALLFTLDISIRWVSEGLVGFFQIADYGWSIFDVVIMFLTLSDTMINIVTLVQRSSKSAAFTFLESISVLRVLRVAQVVKIARVIRLMSFFRELRLMMYSIMGSLKQLLWVALILGMTFYVFGLTLTTGAVHHLGDLGHLETPDTQGLHASFGTLSRSLLTLFMSMAGGRSWGEFYILLSDLPAQYCVLFLVFLAFTLYAVLNIVTGVFVESALRATHNNRQVVVAEELDSKKVYLRNLRDLFLEMDTNGDGSLSSSEFEQRLQDERVVAYFKAMKLDVRDTRTLFHLLDTDHDQTVDMLEFLDGCYELQGESRSIDTKLMKLQLNWLAEKLTQVPVPNAGTSSWSNNANGSCPM